MEYVSWIVKKMRFSSRFSSNETIDQLAMANSVCWHGHVLSSEDGHVLIRALDFEVEGQIKVDSQRKKGRLA